MVMTDPEAFGGRKVAVLGTGIIGAPVAKNLRKRFAVSAWNRTPAKAEQTVSPAGVEVFDAAADAVAGAEVIVTVLKDGPAVLETMTAATPGLTRGAVWVQLSTVGATATEELAGFAERNGLIFYDAPVQGTRQPAENGRLLVMASGPESHRRDAQAVFDAIGGRTVWVSAQAGAASRLKLALNALVAALTHGTAESLLIAEALGVDPRLVVDVVTGGPLDSAFFQSKASAILTDDYSTSFSVTNSIKDALLVVEAAGQAGIDVDVTAAGLERFRRAARRGHGDKDMAASYLAG
ncbi:NAD(P)-dependent oxidoreductase [Streptosporangium sandarakinum]|uniref:NAD(P)-dependent oxidoreductase n=1 Tax=Streptosporangium sandarakinum TaxID=1260955 RepID=UPI0033B00589